jgi:Uma2 family endonuclease
LQHRGQELRNDATQLKAKVAVATQSDHIFTFEEYLDQERQANFKSEFHAGRIFAMSGGTERRSRLTVQVLARLASRLEGCRVYDSNLKNLY